MVRSKFLVLVLVLISSISFIGCENQHSDELSVSVVMCENGWTNIEANSTVSSSDATQLKFSHDSTGTKKVCVLTGSALVVK